MTRSQDKVSGERTCRVCGHPAIGSPDPYCATPGCSPICMADHGTNYLLMNIETGKVIVPKERLEQ